MSLMSLSQVDAKTLPGRLVGSIAEECEISFKGPGQTTWKRIEVARGLEADESFYFQREELEAAAKARDSKVLADFPNPDLAIEVDISLPQIDRAGIFAALNVAEVWRFDGEQVVIDRLTVTGPIRQRRQVSLCRSGLRRSFAGSSRKIRPMRPPGPVASAPGSVLS